MPQGPIRRKPVAVDRYVNRPLPPLPRGGYGPPVGAERYVNRPLPALPGGGGRRGGG